MTKFATWLAACCSTIDASGLDQYYPQACLMTLSKQLSFADFGAIVVSTYVSCVAPDGIEVPLLHVVLL